MNANEANLSNTGTYIKIIRFHHLRYGIPSIRNQIGLWQCTLYQLNLYLQSELYIRLSFSLLSLAKYMAETDILLFRDGK